jgi:hypothetical protein
MKVNVIGEKMEQAEVDTYVEYVQNKFPEKEIATIDLEIDGDFVNVNYTFANVPFERIRRITGYLVGTVDRFNNGKRAEEHDRVKHDTTCYSNI